MHRRICALLFTLAAGCVPIGGGGDAGAACPELACGPTYRIAFARAVWPAGDYRVAVTTDGVPGSCDVVIPLSCENGPRCQGATDWHPDLVGCALDPGQQSIAGITFDRARPSLVAVQVIAGDRTLGSQTFQPTYTTTPGSAACPMSCTQARSDEMALAP